MTSMALGLATPILTRTQAGPAWLADGTIEDVAQIVSEADRLGFDFCTCSEHVGVPDSRVRPPRRGVLGPARDASASSPADVDHPLRHVGARARVPPPARVAKRYGQLDLVSDGRLVLGVGVGTLREEFELLGATVRGPR